MAEEKGIDEEEIEKNHKINGKKRNIYHHVIESRDDRIESWDGEYWVNLAGVYFLTNGNYSLVGDTMSTKWRWITVVANNFSK